mgnify:CR=1 FL=1
MNTRLLEGLKKRHYDPKTGKRDFDFSIEVNLCEAYCIAYRVLKIHLRRFVK